eukprot:6678352-Alexandrium_andersonii.AAC.1
MSASLVGSEMCIRDSHSKEPVSMEGDLSMRLMSNTRSQSFQSFPRCANSVSYTHLTLPTICSV